MPTVIDRPRVETTEETRSRLEPDPEYAVVLHDDDVNGFDFVVHVLQKVFGYGEARAFQLTLEAHLSGHCVVWTGPLEIAELHAERIHACGPDPLKTGAGARPLRATVEPLAAP